MELPIALDRVNNNLLPLPTKVIETGPKEMAMRGHSAGWTGRTKIVRLLGREGMKEEVGYKNNHAS